ncbi:MAG: hypothetical protein GY705_13745 [Bacteroidetes bacterium]|nr:hypothetical protein [Bacteroidota bacterium]
MIKRIFYNLRPWIPRRLQIELRRIVVNYQRQKFSHVWPIDPSAGKPPKNWSGWPEKKKFALVLSHDVDTQIGHDNCRHLMNLEIEMGFRSSFNFVPERYTVSRKLRNEIVDKGFGICVHGLKHDGKLFSSKKIFQQRAGRINHYLEEWGTKGFTSPSMHRNLLWMHYLNIEFDTSTFDTDPFEPQPEGINTVFPFWVIGKSEADGFVELPYTLPQDFTLFVLMQEKGIDIWKKKLDWLFQKGGMALLNTHPDYMCFNGKNASIQTYPSEYYENFLKYVKNRYEGQYWAGLPREISDFCKSNKHKVNNCSPAVQADNC